MNGNNQKTLLVIILLCSSLLFFKTPGTSDVNDWIRLAHYADKYGVVDGYAATANEYAHPPGMALFSFISTRISTSLGLSELLGIKLSMYFFLFLSLIILYLITENYYLSIISFFLLMINSLGLMYLDIYFTPFLILSIFFLKKKNILLTTVFYCLASMIKMQVIVLMPFFVLQILDIHSLNEIKYLDYKKISLNFILPYFLIFLAVLIIYGMPFLISFKTAYKEDMLSGLAANIGWIITFVLHLFSPDTYGSLGSTNFNISMIRGNNIFFSILKYIFMISYAIIFWQYFKLKDKSFDKFLLYTTAAFLSYFIFNKGVHENHLHIAVILLIFLYGEDKKHLVDTLTWGILYNLNMISFYSYDGTGFWNHIASPPYSYRVIKYLDLTLLFSFICVGAYFIFINAYILKRNDQLS